MSTNDPRQIIDGFSAIRRGVHSGLDPHELAQDQLAFAVNAQFRTGVPKQRPAIVRRALTFSDEDAEEQFTQGLWQGGYPYRYAGTSRLLASISGRFYVINPSSFTVTDLTITGRESQSWPSQVWMEQAEMFVVRQDGGHSVPLIFDGSTLVESNVTGGQIPGGRMMRYAQGRLWMVMPNGRDFIAGNLVYGPDGTPAYSFRDSVLWFTENLFLDSGGAFTVGDEITALCSQATIDTTLGQGPLVVFYAGGAALVNAPFDRTQWATVDYPIQTVGVLSHGALGHYSTITINNDIWYRASDGIRSFRTTRRDDSSWGQTPMSYEMDRVMRFDQENLLSYGSAALFDNRLLMTASPFIVPLRGVCSRGFVALDFQQVSSLERSDFPAYDGLWTGLNILSVQTLIVDGRNRCFIWALDTDENIALYELTTEELFDGDGSQRVEWSIETPSYRFGNEGVGQNLMELKGNWLYRSHLVGEVDFCVSYRADRFPIWNELDQWCWTDCAQQGCLIVEDGVCSLLPNQLQYRRPKKLTMPPMACQDSPVVLSNQGYEFQFKIDVTGPAELELFKPWTYEKPEARWDRCASAPDCETLRQCSGYLFNYQITT